MRTPRPGLTLLEMTIVLTILAVLTTLAISLTEGTVDQARFELTQRQLQTLQDSILGSRENPDSLSFVADMGRLPRLIQDADDPNNLVPKELWTPVATRLYGPIAASDPEIRLNSGWRGPYLTFSAGQTHLRDGWGTPFLMLQGTGVPSVTGGFVERVRANNVDKVPPFNATLEMPTVIGTTTYTGTVQGMVYLQSSSAPPATAAIMLYRPSGDTAVGFVSETQALSFTASNMPGSTNHYIASYTFANIPAGPVALRVYESPTNLSLAKSTVVYTRVPSRGTVVRDLYLTSP